MNAIQEIRDRVMPFFIGFLWVHVPAILVIGLIFNNWVGPTLGAGLLCMAVTAAWKIGNDAASTRYLSAVAQMGVVAIILFQFAGHPWQIDVHMYFFAALAMLAVFCDWKTILVGAATVAIHHLLLNFVIPAAIFPDGAAFFRVVLHAGILIVETLTLMWITARLVSAFSDATVAIERATTAEDEAGRLSREQVELETRSAEESSRARVTIAEEFETKVGRLVEALFDRASEMEAQSQTLNQVANEARQRSDSTNRRAEEVTSNTQTVASATEEMSASTQEIVQQVSRSSDASNTAVQRVEETNATVLNLAEAAEKIGAVTGLISDIAEQTNLLALNATIEAARAGEAGKGFAVVAGEVKDLANQTAKATEEITVQVTQMQSVTSETVRAIGDIKETISEINEMSRAVSSSVNEQNEAVSEISRNTSLIADGARGVTDETNEMRDVADRADGAANTTASAAQDLVRQIEGLKTEVMDFAEHVRSA